jgi:hypothetical protein
MEWPVKAPLSDLGGDVRRVRVLCLTVRCKIIPREEN